MVIKQAKNCVQNTMVVQLVVHFASLFDRYNYPRMQNFDVKKAVF